MELIRGNLLVFVTFAGMIGFLLMWLKSANYPFERAFSFLREANRKKEAAATVRLLIGFSVGCIALYCLLCLLLKGKMVPLYYLLEVVGALGFTYLVAMGQGVRKDARVMVYGIMVVTLIPTLGIFFIIMMGLQLDQYCGYLAVVFLVVNLLLAFNLRNYWRKGDL